jgi:hypothetical protein
LAQDTHALQFISEYQLTAEPLRIDIVIIKKIKDIPLTKNIAAIFRTHNLVEYKSPTDYLSVVDFYKAMGKRSDPDLCDKPLSPEPAGLSEEGAGLYY